jgi:hypothetical protein
MVIAAGCRLIEQEGGIFLVISNELGCCPICSASLSVRSLRLRGLIDSDGNKIKLLIRRLQCSPCKRIHHELPDCIVPYKRHCAETIENIVTGNTRDVPCDENYIQRVLLWWSIVLPYFTGILESIAEKLKISFNTPPAFRETVRAVANSNNWICPNSICTRSVVCSP